MKHVYYCNDCEIELNLIHKIVKPDYGLSEFQRKLVCPNCKKEIIIDKQTEEKLRPSKREGISSKCKLDPLVVIGMMMFGNEHPCDRCNIDRKECFGYERI